MDRHSGTAFFLVLCGLLAAGGSSCSPSTLRPNPEWSGLKQEIRTKFPQVEQLSVDELAQMLENGEMDAAPLLVDVRPASEFEVSHLPGALNASGAELDRILAQEDSERPVVLYCSVGYRSSAEAARLIERGTAGVLNLEGSIFEWANSGHPVFRGTEQVNEVHPYDETWGRLLDEPLRSYGPDR